MKTKERNRYLDIINNSQDTLLNQKWGIELIDEIKKRYNAKLSRTELIDIVSTHSIRHDYKRPCDSCKYSDLCCLVPQLRTELVKWKYKNICGLTYRPEFVKGKEDAEI